MAGKSEEDPLWGLSGEVAGQVEAALGSEKSLSNVAVMKALIAGMSSAQSTFPYIIITSLESAACLASNPVYA